jgi:dihydroorotate dehydrogenase
MYHEYSTDGTVKIIVIGEISAARGRMERAGAAIVQGSTGMFTNG